MEVAKKKIKIKPGETISIYFLGDVHEGSGNHAEAEYNKAVSIIKDHAKDATVFWAGIGDYIDAINHKDPRFNPAEIAIKYNIVDLANLAVKQAEHYYERTRDIFDRCIALLYGNHEEAYVRHNGFDAVNLLQYLIYRNSKEEKAPPVLGYTGFLSLSIEHEKGGLYDIALSHGAGGGGFREGYGVNKIHDVFRWYNADCYIMGHIHRMMIDTQYKIEVQQGGKDVIRKKHLYGTNGCFMYKSCVGTRGYFEGKPSPESSIGMLRLDITPKRDRENWITELVKVEL